jgi:hypothetical protein
MVSISTFDHFFAILSPLLMQDGPDLKVNIKINGVYAWRTMMTFGEFNERSSSQRIPISQFGFKRAELTDLPETLTVSNYAQRRGTGQVRISGPLLIHVRALAVGDAQLPMLMDAALPQVEKLPMHHLAGGILIIPANSGSLPVTRPYPDYVYRIVVFDGNWEKILQHVCYHQQLTGQIAEKMMRAVAKFRSNYTWSKVSNVIPRLIDPEHQQHIDSCAICQHVFANAIRFAPES